MERTNVLIIRWLRMLGLVLFVTIFSVIIQLAHAQETKFDMAPGGLIFRPLVANQIEPRVGLEKTIDSNLLTLNIGNSLDLLSWKTTWQKNNATCQSELRIGGDLFTWTQIRSEDNFRFPVEDVDYLFGVNVTWRDEYRETQLSAPVVNSFRIRLAHISAHTVDGSYDNYTKQFIYQQPFTYSQEFIDGIYSYENRCIGVNYRALLGAKLIVHTIPGTLTAFAPHYGLELSTQPVVWLTPYFAYDGKMQKITAWQGENSLQLGIKMEKWDGGGISLYLAYYQGKNVHGELYYIDQKTISVGTNLSF